MLGAIAILSVPPAQAQQQPGRAGEPARIDERIQPLPRPAGAPPPTSVAPPPEVAPDIGPAFVLAGVVIEGATIFPPETFVPLYELLLGTSIRRDGITALLDAITEKYRAAGYVLSRAVAPVQDVSLGILRVQVLEGYVERVVFEGAPGGAGLLKAYAERIRSERPLTLATLERYLLLLADLPGMSVSAGVAPIGEMAAAHELLLRVERDPAELFLGFDNRGTATIGRHVGEATLYLNSLFDANEAIMLRGITVPATPSELRFGEVRAQLPLGDDGFTLTMDAWRSAIATGGRLKSLDLDSEENRVAVAFGYPLRRSRALSLYLGALLEYRDTSQDAAGDRVFQDRTWALRLGARLFFDDGWGGSNAVYATLSQGLGLPGASDKGDARLSRLGGDPQFTKLVLEMVRRQKIYGPLNLQGWFYGQVSGDSLLSGEEFRLGGGIYGRAYDSSEVVGEQGVAAALELQYDLTVAEAVSGLQLFAFYDHGVSWDRVSGSGTFRNALSSAGLGTRFRLLERLQVTLEAAKPLNRDVIEEGDRSWRFFFSLGLTF
ncbi:ShlB/FhaC/HecB family hemolysin secretion/activation protein [Desertibaculum subflavum]|uniref:ShlB/FhaC/HecB family hemolysin secretion/activation protein n=1 Tax=Desertibaculum subflavum TaxID=2268458 RepID=UPI0013C51C1C